MKSVKKSFGQVEAVRGIDLDVRTGEIFGSPGPNGAGKTTTISILCTLLRATAGQASVAGIDVKHDPAGVRSRSAGQRRSARTAGRTEDLIATWLSTRVCCGICQIERSLSCASGSSIRSARTGDRPDHAPRSPVVLRPSV